MDAEEEERRRRAAELREQVERLKSGEEAPEGEEAEPVAESPREFIRRKMREEDEEEEAEASEDEEPTGED